MIEIRLSTNVLMKKPYETGDPCPQCGSDNVVYDWEMYCEVCCACDYQIVFDDELVDEEEE